MSECFFDHRFFICCFPVILPLRKTIADLLLFSLQRFHEGHILICNLLP